MRRLRSYLRSLAHGLGDLVLLIPALLAGAGVFLVVAGLFYYLQPVSANATATPTPTPAGSVAAYSLPPIKSAGPSGSASLQGSIATRIKVPALAIDLPVVASPPNEQFPLCYVAEYISLDKHFAYPGLPQATYIYAHAQTGMFGPLLVASKVNDGAAMIGMWVEVYTDDNQRHIYEITEVIRGVLDTSASLDRALKATDRSAVAADIRRPQGDFHEAPDRGHADRSDCRQLRRCTPDRQGQRVPHGAQVQDRGRERLSPVA